MSEDNYRKLKEYAESLDIDLFGVADIEDKEKEVRLSSEIKQRFPRAISIGVVLSKAVLDEIDKQPTKLYYYHYRMANMFLDQTAFKIAKFIQVQGYKSLPIPASQIIDWQKQSAALSHRHVARLAGLGWIGRNNLLVNPKFGSQVRLASILTNMPLKANSPIEQNCSDCKMCLTVCLVSAIKERQEDFDHLSCFSKLKEFQKRGIVGQFICGMCLKVCASQ